VEAKWEKKNQWETRGLSQANKWVDVLEDWHFEDIVNSQLQKMGAVVVASYLQCRGSAANAALESIKDALMPAQPLGEMTPIPGQAMTKCVRGFCVVVDKNAAMGSTISLADMPAVAFLAMNPADWTTTAEPTQAGPTDAPGNGTNGNSTTRQLKLEKVPRRLESLSSLPPSCYTTVRSATDNTFVGQVIGGCLEVNVGEGAVSGISVDLPIDPEIPVDSDFTAYAVASQQFTDSGPALVATSLPATHVRQETDFLIRTTIQSSGMYCPVARLPANSQKVGQSGCDEIASVQSAILQSGSMMSGNAFGSPTPSPTEEPTLPPFATVQPTAMPTSLPTSMPTSLPTSMPTSLPTSVPTPRPTAAPGEPVIVKVVTTMALAVSAAAIQSMMSNPTEAVAGLAKGFADFLGLPADQVKVLSTVPDLFGGSSGSRQLSDTGTRLEVEYEVLQAPDSTVDVTTLVEDLASAPAPTALVDNLESALAEQGMTVEVQVLEVSQPTVTTIPVPTPSPTPKPQPPVADPDPEPVKPEPEDTTSDSGGNGMFFMGGAVVALVVIIGVGAFVYKQQATPGHPPPKDNEEQVLSPAAVSSNDVEVVPQPEGEVVVV
jgi:hypothetical protein